MSAAHCATRLRLVTNDNKNVDMKKLENVEGVKGVFSSNGQLQIILGTGTVNKVYDEFLAVSGMTAATKAEVKTAGGIIIPDSAKEKPLKGKVVATGNGTKDEEMVVKVGDTVLYGKYAGTELEVEGVKYLMMRQSDILAVIE